MTSGERIQAAAHEWRAILAEQPTLEEQSAFRDWCRQDPRHKEAYERAEALWSQVGTLDYAALAQPQWKPSLGERLRTGWQALVPPVPLAPALAAVALVALVSLWLIRAPTPSAALDALTYASEVGEVRALELSDGSRLVLGPASETQVQFSAGERRVELLRGNAFVDVRPNPERPFLLVAGPVIAQAVGTAYEVRHRHDGFQVAVAEGQVSVFQAGDGHRLLQLARGEQVHALSDATNGVTLGLIEAIPVSQVGAWQEHRLVYRGASLDEVVFDANRYSTLPIEIADPALSALRITATFQVSDPELMLATLAEAFPVRVDRSNPERIYLLTP